MANALNAKQAHDRRTRKRSLVRLPGKLFVPHRNTEADCFVLDISAGGAGIKSTCSADLGTQIVLYLEGFGRIEGRVALRHRLRIGMEFLCTDAKRDRIEAQIANYIMTGSVAQTSVRSSLRVRDISMLRSFTVGSGTPQACEVDDIALSGVSLRTPVRPPIGERIAFGNTIGEIVRHNDAGIVVKFVALVKSDGLPPRIL